MNPSSVTPEPARVSTARRCDQPTWVLVTLPHAPSTPTQDLFLGNAFLFLMSPLLFLQRLPPPTRRKLDLDLVLYFHLTFRLSSLSNPLSTLSSPVSRGRVAVSLTAMTVHRCLKNVLGKLSRCKPLWGLKARICLLNFGFLF